jgi:hypothetical protein
MMGTILAHLSAIQNFGSFSIIGLAVYGLTLKSLLSSIVYFYVTVLHQKLDRPSSVSNEEYNEGYDLARQCALLYVRTAIGYWQQFREEYVDKHIQSRHNKPAAMGDVDPNLNEAGWWAYRVYKAFTRKENIRKVTE